ncbi:4Fe-4S dicluster domain-containing protein, partial [Citrobacter freundii]|uniref:4Fe-4S dicluster domain-containing protein n=1 Tax=Citrobacter freundii TaxID=546 RepID=UPI000FE12873
GVVVNNVQTVLNIARAVEQQYPVTRRTLTVNGAVAKPITVTVPIGMSLRDHLIGHELAPHLLVRAVNYQQLATPQLLLTALTCSECNVCASVACPVGISP